MSNYIPFLSKSRFIKGLQCHKALWFQTFKPELQDEVSESQQAVFDSGTDVGLLAQQLFPGGIEVPFSGMTYSDQIAMTLAEIEKGTKTIYEATFSHNGVFCKVDILHHGSNGWELHEVKSSTGCKDVYIDDIAVQYHIVTGSGLSLAYAGLIHVNSSYVKNGGLELDRLFSKVDLTNQIISMQTTIAAEVSNQLIMLQGGEPEVAIGPHCDDPYPCAFKGHCWQHIPENSVFDFCDKGRPNCWKLYDEGFIEMKDVPEGRLGWRQQLQLRGVKEEFLQIDNDAVHSFLEGLIYPLSFLDFETTYMLAVPLWDGTRPYQQIPFQFSLHIMERPDSKLIHREYLATDACDPRLGFLEALLRQIPLEGNILTWNAVFEVSRLKELAIQFPEYSKRINQIIERVVDLMILFRDKSIYHSSFNGSYSIKQVLPGLVQDLSYGDLEISNGEMASSGWLQMINSASKEEQGILNGQLLEYCCLDTLGMVRIFQEVQSMIVKQ